MTSAEADNGEQGEQAGGVLRRMLRSRSQAEPVRAPILPPAPPPTPAKAAATAIGRTAERLYGLAIPHVKVAQGVMTLAELPEMLPDLPLVVVLQGPGENLGAISLCPQTVASLIEIQALGRVTARPLERRRPTRSDATLCADFINLLLTELAAETDGLDGFQGIAGYRFLTALDDPRPLALMLEDKPLRSLTFDLRMGSSDLRDGQVLLVLPQARKQPAPKPQPTPAPVAAPKVTVAKPSLGAPMQQASVEVVGVLCRRKVSLAELRTLAPGRVLQLPRACLTDARLETADGQILAAGKFGEAEGCHAIRLRDRDAAPATETAPAARPAPMPDAPEDLARPDPFRPGTALAAPQDGAENATILRQAR
ncbi:FliM/FliN family flagellar motor C-terminal domain-containing protein [Paracoccus sp. R86501]|uniref:FliM/FliN family flagellar motor switch protein n=1 Tax=Paracoccus sp. R86501 TaxID=3101711 RepID=UPI0036707F33